MAGTVINVFEGVNIHKVLLVQLGFNENGYQLLGSILLDELCNIVEPMGRSRLRLVSNLSSYNTYLPATPVPKVTQSSYKTNVNG